MRLRKYTIRSIVALLVPIVATAVWLQSYVAHDRFVWRVGGDSWGIVNCNGRLQVRVIQDKMPTGHQQLRGAWASDEKGIWEIDGVALRERTRAWLASRRGSHVLE
jgi:hypothetical protein